MTSSRFPLTLLVPSITNCNDLRLMLLEADRLGQMSSAQGNTVLKLSFSPHISSSRLLKPLRDIAPLGSDY
ncbi:MAG TPA: hypothetical protein PLN52_26245 [Opitutaceae bacterium]|jgi:hypothetical protein|nr:hypothetical protein [Opitutaceae bacterium]